MGALAIDLVRTPVVVSGGVQVTWGVDAARLEEGSNLRTYLLAPRGGMLTVGKALVEIPPRSVTVLRSGVRASFRPTQRSLEQVVLRVPVMLPSLRTETAAFLRERGVRYALDTVQAHAGIREHRSLGVRVLPKFLLDGGKVPGWACNLHKGEPIGIEAGAEWTAVRESERYHYHEHTHEQYVILDGTGTYLIAGDEVELPRGTLLSCPPRVPHKVHRIAPGGSGLYAHVTFHYPQIPPAADDKVNVPL